MIQPQVMVSWIRVILQIGRKEQMWVYFWTQANGDVEKQRLHKNAPRFFGLGEGMDFLSWRGMGFKKNIRENSYKAGWNIAQWQDQVQREAGKRVANTGAGGNVREWGGRWDCNWALECWQWEECCSGKRNGLNLHLDKSRWNNSCFQIPTYLSGSCGNWDSERLNNFLNCQTVRTW